MKFNPLNQILLLLTLVFPQATSAQIILNLQTAIELALAHDPRVEEKRAFVRKAEALLDEAKGSAGLRYGVDSFLAVTSGVDGGFFQNGDESCSTNCTPRDDVRDFNDGLSLWAGLNFSVIKPLMTFGRLENYQRAAQQNIVIKQQDV